MTFCDKLSLRVIIASKAFAAKSMPQIYGIGKSPTRREVKPMLITYETMITVFAAMTFVVVLLKLIVDLIDIISRKK